MKYWYLLILELLYARSKVDDEMECQREESWKISSRENYHLNASREIVPGSIGAAASRSRLCARIDEFFTKPNASVLKRFYFIPSDVFSSHVFVTRHLHSARVFLIVFKSTAMGNGMNLEIPIFRIFPIYPYDIDDIPLFWPGSSCIIIWGYEGRIVRIKIF